jgi:hypothetical protein
MQDRAYGLRRIHLLRTRVNKALLVCLLIFRISLRAQPQREVGGLHRLLYHPYEVVGQSIEVRLVSQFRGEALQSLPRIVLLAVEAPVDEGLDASPQRIEQGSDHEGGDDYGQLRLLLLAGKHTEEHLDRRHASEVEDEQHGRQRTVDEGTVYEEVYVVEAVSQDGQPYGYRDAREQDNLDHVGQDRGDRPDRGGDDEPCC